MRDLTAKMAAAHRAHLAARRAERDAENARLQARYEQSMARLMDLYHTQAIREDWQRTALQEIVRATEGEVCLEGSEDRLNRLRRLIVEAESQQH